MRPAQRWGLIGLIVGPTPPLAVLALPRHPGDQPVGYGADGLGEHDAGTGLGADRWLHSVATVCDLNRLAGVLGTHYHADHAGGAAALDVYAEPVIHLDDIEIDALLPGHGEQVLHDAATDISAAARSFARLVPPPNRL